MGFLIAIDGVDASGKETHTKMICEKLSNDGYNVKSLSFPDYDSPSSELVKMYLSGKFGENPNDVNAYAASTFFAADRFASYRTKWINDYNEDTIIIADRYVSSNIIHQASKIEDVNEKDEFIKWVNDLEYNKYAIPTPDITIFLDMPTKFGMEFIKQRDNKIDGSQQKDIHESNVEYMRKSYKNAVYVAAKCGWHRIRCVKDDHVRTFEEINKQIYDIVIKAIK